MKHGKLLILTKRKMKQVFNTEIAILILLGVFVVCMVLRVPITFSIMVASFACAYYMGMSPMSVVLNMVQGLRNFSLLAIPFFILMGEIMGAGGISDKILGAANAIVGRVRGGLGLVNILATKLFSGMTGSAVADTSTSGSILIPMMKKQGYDDGYSVAVTCASSAITILIPPSHNMVIYAVVAGAGVSVAELFLAGVFPGILVGVLLLILCYVLSLIRKYPISDYISPKERVKAIINSIPPLLTVIIIMGGVSFGIFTATESAAIACLYAFFLTFVVYRKIPLKTMYPIIIRTLRTLAMVLCLIASASAFGALMTRLQVPAMMTNVLLSISDNRFVIFLLINLLLLVLGTVMDMSPMILIMTPILLPVVTSFGMSPVHFGVVLLYNLAISMSTPPVGTVLFTGCAIGKVSVERASKSLLPMYIVMIFGLFLVTYIPMISMWLPGFIRG
jgi:tripartite ATP-independent transporter DctM subunit